MIDQLDALLGVESEDAERSARVGRTAKVITTCAAAA
jgi:hypothetical protein